MSGTELQTTGAVMEALGGYLEVARLTSRKPNAASNWLSQLTFPPDTYVVMQAELKRRGKTAPDRLWRMVGPVGAGASEAQNAEAQRSAEPENESKDTDGHREPVDKTTPLPAG